MKADPFAQLRLLDVQELDSRQDQLRHRLATLPQLAELKDLTRQRAEVDDRARDVRIAVDDLTRAQKRADADVELQQRHQLGVLQQRHDEPGAGQEH